MPSPMRKNTRRGAAAVEFALVLPLLLIMLLGMWEFGRIIDVQQTLSTAAREAGREASLGFVQQCQHHWLREEFPVPGGIIGGSHCPYRSHGDERDLGQDATVADQLDHFTITISVPYSDVRWSPD